MTTAPIVLLAPAALMQFVGMPSGTVYVADQQGLIVVANGSVADEQALIAAGCAALSPSPQYTSLDFTEAVNAATTGALPANTYSNGTAGVGATLTGTSNGAFPAIDGVAASLNNRYWVMNEATAAHNGIYALTQVGTGSTPYILTRTTDADTAALLSGIAALVLAGTTNIGNSFAISAAAITVGTTALTVVQVGGPGGIAAETARAEGVEAVLAGKTAAQNTYPATAGSSSVAGGTSIISGTAISSNGYLSGISFYSSAAVQVTLFVCSISGGNATLQYSQVVSIASGANTLTNFNPFVEAGWYIGIYSQNTAIEFSSGGTCYTASGIPGSSTAVSSSPNTACISWQITSGDLGLLTETTVNLATALGTATITQGVASPASGTNGATGGSTWLGNTPISQNGTLSQVQFYSRNAGTVTLLTATMTGGNIYRLQSAQFSATVGLNTITTFNPVVALGQYVGIYCATAAIPDFSTLTGASLYNCLGLASTSGTALNTTDGSLTINMNWTVTPGVAGEALRAQAEETSLQSQITASLGGTVNQGQNPPVSGSFPGAGGDTLISPTAFSASGLLSSVSMYCSTATAATLVIVTISGANATLVQSVPVTVAAGLNTFTAAQLVAISPSFNPYVFVGQYIGLYTASTATLYYTPSAGTFYYCSSLVGTSTALSTASSLLQIGWQITTGLSGETGRAQAIEAGLQNQLNGQAVSQGVNPPVAGTSGSTSGLTVIPDTPISQNGFLTNLSFYANSAGPATLVVASVSGSNLYLQASMAVDMVAGLNEFPNFNPYVQAGWFVGIYSAAAGAMLQSSSGRTVNSTTGLVSASGTALRGASSNVYLCAGWTVSYGLVQPLQATLAITSQIAQSGLGLFEGSDPTGVNSSQQAFVDAQAAHPAPSVPQGNFTASSLINDGWGLWKSDSTNGVTVGGVTLSLPAAPRRTSTWLSLRARLVSQIYSGSCFIFVGDSITDGAYAATFRLTFAGLFTRFANLGIALDEAVFANFDTTDAAGGPAFYGVTFVSPPTVTNGTNGPLAKSLLLAAGQSMSFTGAYSQVDVTYTGVSGGQLAFAYNGGAAYKTLSCASTGSDVYSGPSVTGETASGTYTVTNTGSVAVEITSLVRLGVLTSGAPPRLYVCVFAHGGYQFTNYGTPQVQSMYRIASIFGGSNHFVSTLLGTNDEVGAGLSYATLKANVTAYISEWVAAGIPVSNMLCAMPWRWGNAYPSGASFEQGNAAIRDAFAAAGVDLFAKTDGIDFVAFGLTATGDGHPSTAGHLLTFNILTDALAA